jgi:hypothetical protein
MNKCFWGVERGRCVRLITSPTSVSLFSRQCAIINISQPSIPPRPVTKTVFYGLFNDGNRVHGKLSRPRKDKW